MKRTLARGASFIAAAALFAAVAGCGGGDSRSTSGGSDSELVRRPSAERPISAEVAGFERALRNKSCEEFQPLVFSTIRARPAGAPASTAECRREGFLAAGYAHRVREPVSKSREYGTVALMESPAGGGHREYTVWVLDSDGRFRFTETEGVFDPQIGTAFEDRAAAERAAESFVRAVDEHDCSALLRVLHEKSRFVTDQESPRATCRAVLDGVYFAPAVRATPDPEIDVIGGTRTFAFIGVPTTNAYFTLSMGQSLNGGIRVVDVLPNTPLEPAEA